MNRKQLILLTIGCITTMLLNNEIAYSTETTRNESNTVLAPLPAYYPSHFHKLGVLSEIRSQYDWVVDGIGIKVSNNVIVHSLITNFSSLYSIKQGMELGYRKNSQGEIAEIWQLPSGTINQN